MDTIANAQKDMRDAYNLGIPGIISSGVVWLIAGLCAYFLTPFKGVIALVIGGMFIFPLSLVLCKLMGYSGSHSKGNPLAPLATENTIWMISSIPIAVVLSIYNVSLFFPAMLLVIAGRYLTFSTLYGMKSYYLLGGLLGAAAIPVAIVQPAAFVGGVTGGVIELVFAAALLISNREKA